MARPDSAVGQMLGSQSSTSPTILSPASASNSMLLDAGSTAPPKTYVQGMSGGDLPLKYGKPFPLPTDDPRQDVTRLKQYYAGVTSRKEALARNSLIDKFVSEASPAMQKEIGMDRLKRGMWHALGLDDVISTEKFDDTPTFGERFRSMLKGDTSAAELKALEQEMEQGLRKPWAQGRVAPDPKNI